MIERFDRLLARPVSMRSLALVRALVGVITLFHLRPFVRAALHGDTYRDHFYKPYLPVYPQLPEGAYIALLLLGCAAAVLMSLGLWTRVSTKVTFGVVAYNLLLSTTHMHNNREYLTIVLGVLALAPCGRALSVDALFARKRGRPIEETSAAWPLWLLRIECAAVYAASGTSKLLDPDWFSGTVTWGRLMAVEANVRSSWLPHAAADLLLDRSFHTFAAKIIIATELFIASGLWWRRTRPFALFAAVMFHIGVEFTANVEVFSYLGIAVLFAWYDPALPWLRWPGRKASPARRVTQEEVTSAGS
jgi:hypothetical protein